MSDFVTFAHSHGVLIDHAKLFASQRIRRCPTTENPRTLNGAYFWDGERGWVWAWDGEGKALGHFNKTSSEARKTGKGEDLRFHIFDLVLWDHLAGGTEPIETRYARLDQVQAFINATTADHACYTAKREGRGRALEYRPDRTRPRTPGA